MKKAYDFFEKWILENEDNIAGKEVNEVYYTYSREAFQAGYGRYRKNMFIDKVKFRLKCTTRDIFIKNKDVYSIEKIER